MGAGGYGGMGGGLAGRHGRTVSQYLVFDEPVLLEAEGRACLIEP